MGKNLDIVRDIGIDNKSDLKSDIGNKSKADYGGDLANDTGVDLNNSKNFKYDNEYGGNGTYNPYHESETTSPLKPEISTEEDYNTAFTNDDMRNSLDSDYGSDHDSDSSYKFSKDTNCEQLDSALDNFRESKWSDLSLEEQKQSITDLAGFVAADTGNENPPEIVFRDDMPDGSYGSYNPSTNTIEINQNMLDDSAEAADTITHEMWHAYQHQCALDTASEKGQAYQEGFDNYISPEYDFEGYQNQMVEAEAREYAQGFKDRLARMKGAV